MKIAYKYLIALFVLTSLTSCEEFFIQELEVPRQNLDNQLVVHSFISDIDTTIHFRVTRNFDLNSVYSEPESRVTGATIRLFRGSELVHEITERDDSTYRLDLPAPFGFSQENYRIEVSHPDYETAVCETEMPSYVNPVSITYYKDGGFASPNGNDRLDMIEITIQDPGDEENYYEFQVHQILLDFEEIIFGEDTIRLETRYPERYFTPDTNFDQGISGFLLSDDTFNGQSYTFQIMLSNFTEEELEVPVDKLRVTWNCVSKDHYEYSKSLLRYQRSSGFGLFSDPIAIFSNVDKGLGVVSLRSSRILGVEEN